MSEIDKYRARHEQQGRREKDKQATKGFGRKTFRHPDKITRFTWWVSIFTGCLFFAALIQSWAFIQSERAFISPAALKFTPPTISEKIAIFDIQIKNSGRTTANIKHNIYTVTPILSDIPSYPTMDTVALAPVVPGGFIQSQIKIGPLSDEVTKGLLGTTRFYIYGLIEYEDDFSFFSYKKSGWCFVFNPAGNPNVSQLDSCNNSNYTYSR